ncbi:cysteine-rich receptor-like protein kinase 34 [Carex rostrata]
MTTIDEICQVLDQREEKKRRVTCDRRHYWSLKLRFAVVPVGKKAIIFYDKCSLRYSNSNSTTPEEKSWGQILYNVGTISDAQAFQKLYNDLMGSLVAKAANSSQKFALGEANFTSDTTMYGLAQCMRDLSVKECHTCLNQSMGNFQSCCNKNQGGVVLRYECYIRMEIYPYFESNGEDVFELSPPPLSIMSPPPPQSVPVPVPVPVPDSGITPSSTQITGSKDKKKILALVIVPSICGFIILMVALFCILRRRRRIRSMPQPNCTSTYNEEKETSTPHLFKLETLRIATNYFSPSNKLGEGGFGSVYKGCLPSGEEIAVKRLSLGSGQGVSELKNEVLALANLQHKNLVKLLGFCLNEHEKLLVYEFLPNKSLDKLLSDPQKDEKLDWQKRYQIIKGVTRGLLYLHEESRIKIIHRDLKTSNILLDESMLPKISDFGLAKLFNIDKSQGTASRIAGTNGYIAPECFMRRHVSTKSDVFSYGVIILEILTGRSVRDFNGSGSNPNLLSLVWKEWCNGRALQVIDERLHDSYRVYEALNCLTIALLCVQNDPSKRPNMASVSLMLSSNSMNTPTPSTPAFFIQDTGTTETGTQSENSDRQSRREIGTRPNHISVNSVTITEMGPR